MSICFAVLTFLILTGSAVFSGVCGVIREINKDQVHELYRFKDLDPQVIDLAERCIFSNSTGNIKDMFATNVTNSDHLKQIVYQNTISDVLNGASEYQIYE